MYLPTPPEFYYILFCSVQFPIALLVAISHLCSSSAVVVVVVAAVVVILLLDIFMNVFYFSFFLFIRVMPSSIAFILVLCSIMFHLILTFLFHLFCTFFLLLR